MLSKQIKYLQHFPDDFFKLTFSLEEKKGYVRVFKKQNFGFMTKNKSKKVNIPDIYLPQAEFDTIKLDEKELKDHFKQYVTVVNNYRTRLATLPPHLKTTDPEIVKLSKSIDKTLGQLFNFIRIYENLQKMERQRQKQAKKERNIALKNKEIVLEKEWFDNVKVYHDLFPVARGIQRKVTLFIGPTNSGKTWSALNKLVSFNSGTYLAPLRLLALEGKDEIEERGKPCSFITGEEREIIKGAKFTAQTIETFNYRQTIEAVLIDEVQLISDPQRGWAWTQAFVGAPAENIILTGSLDCLDIITHICELLGDELEVVNLDRKTTLEINSHPLSAVVNGNLSSLEPNTALIVFSRKAVLEYKAKFEEQNLPVSVIYGNLSPEVRREEARKFREGKTKYLISTDAIAMGLNLPIKHIIFGQTSKWNGEDDVYLSPNEVRQIAGRAGRFNKFDVGYVHGITSYDVAFLKKQMQVKVELEKTLFVRPTLEQIEYLSSLSHNTSLEFLMEKFFKLTQKQNEIYECAELGPIIQLARILDRHKTLTLQEKYEFAMVPIDSKGFEGEMTFESWVHSFVKKQEITPRLFYPVPTHVSKFDSDALFKAETNVKLLTAYAWLSFHKPQVAPFLDDCEAIKKEMNAFIMKQLSLRIQMQKCSSCSSPLPLGSKFKLCTPCFHMSRRNRYNSYDDDFEDY